MNFMQKLGADFEKAFAWFNSSKVQAAVTIGEDAVEAIYPPADALIGIVQKWTAEAVKTEALAAQTVASGGTSNSAIKAATTISAVTPEILAFAKAAGTPVPDSSTIATANNYLIAFLNVLSGKATSTELPATTVSTSATVSTSKVVPETTVKV